MNSSRRKAASADPARLPDVSMVPIDFLKRNPRNARTHNKKQIRKIKNSIKAFGYVTPIVTDENGLILAGHARYEAAVLCGMKDLRVIILRGLTEPRKRAYMLADNRLAEDAGWDFALLSQEFEALPELLAVEGMDLDITGFESAQIDQILNDNEADSRDPADEIPESAKGPPVTRRGDLWELGDHRLLCGDARGETDLKELMSGDVADMAFLDPPYNVKVNGIGGRGAIKHSEFAMASGEMSPEAFFSFLLTSFTAAASVSRSGAIHYACMDWRHVETLMAAGRQIYGATLNLIAWVKTNAGQGSFYRSQHELIGVFRVGEAPHRNNVELGRHGRDRSNVWRYAGANTFRRGRMEDLKAHPTVKPVAMIADAMKDCTRRGEIVLDTFCGSGSTLLAAERVGRRGRGLEFEPRYVDVAIRRWQAFRGRDAIHAETGLTFDEMTEGRPEVASPRMTGGLRRKGR